MELPYHLLCPQDAKVVDNACVALSHVADAFASQTSLLEVLSSGGLIGQALQLVSRGQLGTRSRGAGDGERA